MLGAAEAQKAIAEIAKRISEQMVRRLPRIALTKTAFYPVIKQIGRWIGINITKNTFARGAARIVPILGGFISGGLTSYMIKKMANRLKDHLKKTIFAQPNKIKKICETITYAAFDQRPHKFIMYSCFPTADSPSTNLTTASL